MFTLLAIAILALSCLLVLGNLRMIAHDTFETLSAAAARARDDGTLMKRLAFLALWLIIFGTSFT